MRVGIKRRLTSVLGGGEGNLARYLISGLFNTGLNFLIYTLLILGGANYLIANSTAWVVGVAVSFTLSSYYVFRKTYQHKRLFFFIASNLFSLGMSSIMLSLLIRVLIIDPILASVITIPCVVMVNFCLLRLVVFN
jgi:putative flippase GtrA